MLCCNECGRETVEGDPWSGWITESGDVEIYDDWRTAGFFEDEDGVNAVSRSVRWCMDCKREVYSYVSHVNWDFRWSVVQKLKGFKYVTNKQYTRLVREEMEANHYEDIPLLVDVPHDYEEYESVPEEVIFKYLQEKKLIGPKEKYLFFFERYKVVVPDNMTKEDIIPYAKVPLDGACEDCGGYDLARVGGSCPICGKGKLEHVEFCEPVESRGKSEFTLAGESFDKELYNELFFRYTQGQISLEKEVRSTAKKLFDGDIRKAAAEHEDFFADAFRSYKDSFTIKGEVFKEADYPCLFVAYCDFKIETVTMVLDTAEKQFGGDIRSAVAAEDKRLLDQGLCSSRISRVTSKRCGTC